MEIINTLIKSRRNTDIPVTLIEADHTDKLLICVHGFRSNRTEDNRFIEVGKALTEYNVSTIIPALPGNDESKEDFINYTLSNCLDDIDSSYQYMKDNYSFNNVSMIGYSMGARLVLLYTKNHPEINCIGLWAGATYDGFNNEDSFLNEDLNRLKTEANINGYTKFYDPFDKIYINMSKDFLKEMEEFNITDCLNNYRGNVLIVHGDKDITVPLQVSIQAHDKLINSNDKELLIIKNADHSFGEYKVDSPISKKLTDKTIIFLKNYF